MRVLACVLALAGLQSAAVPPRTQTVRIDVIASDARGRLLEGLTVADFDLRDDGVRQNLDAVRFVRPTDDDGRLIAIYLDEYHVSAGATERVREAVSRLVERQLRPADLLAVMKPLDSLFAIRLTHDRAEAQSAITAFEGRRGNYEPRNAYERNFMAGVPPRIESARTQVTLSALNALAVHFSSYPDKRKTLIVVSEGMGRVERRRGLEFMATPDTIIRSAQQSNVSIYAINPGDVLAAGDGDSIRTLAIETAGQVLADNLDASLGRALNDVAGYYVLTYRASRPDDGKFHPVQVAVRKAGAQIRARKGYYAPSPDETLRATLLAKLNEPKVVVPLEPAPHASPLIRPWFGTSRGADGKTRVTFVWEPAARLTGERNRRTPVRIVFKALAADNTIVYEAVVLPTGPAMIEDAGAPRSRAVFDVAPGRLRVRMSIEDAAQNALDSDVRSLTVRDMRGEVLMATPEVLRARNAREFRTLDSELAVPVASREFSRTERLLIRITTYGPAGTPPAVSARLLSRMGPMRDLPVADGSGAGVNAIDVPLAGLAIGEYIIEVSATTPKGVAKDVIDFRVTT